MGDSYLLDVRILSRVGSYAKSSSPSSWSKGAWFLGDFGRLSLELNIHILPLSDPSSESDLLSSYLSSAKVGVEVLG